MNKPIATIHWVAEGNEHSLNLFDQSSLNNIIKQLARAGHITWTCLLKHGAPPKTMNYLPMELMFRKVAR